MDLRCIIIRSSNFEWPNSESIIRNVCLKTTVLFFQSFPWWRHFCHEWTYTVVASCKKLFVVYFIHIVVMCYVQGFRKYSDSLLMWKQRYHTVTYSNTSISCIENVKLKSVGNRLIMQKNGPCDWYIIIIFIGLLLLMF